MPKTASTQKKPNYINLGCGRTHHPDWQNFNVNSRESNVEAWNARSGIPLASNSAAVVYPSHLLEHLEKEDGINLLEECFRVILPENGILRIVVPDLEDICRSYLDAIERAKRQNEGTLEDLNWMRLKLVDQLVRTKSGGLMLDFRNSDPPNKIFLLKRCGKQVEEHLISPKRTMTTQSEHKPSCPRSPPLGKIIAPLFEYQQLERNLRQGNPWSQRIRTSSSWSLPHRWRDTSLHVQSILPSPHTQNNRVFRYSNYCHQHKQHSQLERIPARRR